MTSTQVTQFIRAPRSAVYRALLDPTAIPKWRVPEGMRCEVHEFDAREGGQFRVSLTYDLPTDTGKTSAQTDTYHGHFERLVPDQVVVEVMEFETSDPSLMGEMRITTTLDDSDGGTLLTGVHEGLPSGVKPEDNEYGWQMSLGKLARLLER